MKAYFDDNETLVIEAENNTEMVALKYWIKSKIIEPTPSSQAIPLRHILVKDAQP